MALRISIGPRGAWLGAAWSACSQHLGWPHSAFLRVEGFPGGPLFDFQALCSSLTLAKFGKEIRRCSGVYFVGCVWMKGHRVSCRFCGGDDNDGHLFWDFAYPPLVEFRENPEFHDLLAWVSVAWGCRWFLGVNRGCPWAENSAEGVQVICLKVLLVLILLISFLTGNCRLDLMLVSAARACSC